MTLQLPTFLHAAMGCALVGSFLASSAPAAPRSSRDSAGVKTMLVLGDSISAGFRLERSEAYPSLLAEKIRAAGYGLEVINASVSGDTSAGGLRRLPTYLRRPVDVLLLELGINDAFRGVSIDQIGANLQGIIDLTKARYPNVAVVIAGMALPQFASDPYVGAFGRMFGALAEKNHAVLVPYLLEGVAGNPTLNLPDGVHPNTAGQRILAANVWPVLEPVLRQVSRK